MQRDQDIEVESAVTAPLLGQKGRVDAERSPANNRNGAHDWPGQTDFEGLPWYKTPSVNKIYIALLSTD